MKTTAKTLLEQVKRNILKHPTQFVMHSYFAYEDSIGNTPGGCGTAACIAGWTVHLWKGKATLEETSGIVEDTSSPFGASSTFQVARKALGLTTEQADNLFRVMNWPAQFRCDLKLAPTAGMAAKVAAKRIDHFIRTEGEE